MVLRAALLTLGLVFAVPALAVDDVVLHRDGKEMQVSGRLLVKAQDGGLLLLARDGTIWAIPPEEQVKHTSDTTPFQPLTRDELSKRVLAELPRGFEVHPTAHYLIFYDTSRAYAQWCGSLFERLYLAFTNYWSRRGFDLSEPEFPLVAIVFADRPSYMEFTRPELALATESIIGYYALASNRMTMYDLTGVEAQGHAGRGSTMAQINQVLAQPRALQTVSTIIHEATHQIAFNCGLHTRLSDCPLWFCEGIAVYFETPDLRNAKGWNGIGVVNQPRLEQFLKYCETRPADSLETLVRDDKRFRDTRRSADAYAEAWAVTYFLLNKRSKEYVAYLRMLSKKPPLLEDKPQTRLDEFRHAFGDLKQLNADFLRYMQRLR